MKDMWPTIFIEKALSSIELVPVLVVRVLDINQELKADIVKKFQLKFINNGDSQVNIVATSDKPGSHKLGAITLFATALYIKDKNPEAILAFILKNELLEAARKYEKNISYPVFDCPQLKTLNKQTGIMVFGEIRVLLSSCGFPIENQTTGLLSHSEHKECFEYFGQFKQVKVRVA